MSRHLVLCFRWCDRETEPTAYLAVAAEIALELEQIGGAPIGWSGEHQSFAFRLSELRALLTGTLRLMSRYSELGAAIVARPLFEQGERCWGPALLLAEGLAKSARRGEILLDPELDAVKHQQLATVGLVQVELGREYIEAALMIAGATSVGGFRSTLPPEMAVEAQPRSKPEPAQRPALVIVADEIATQAAEALRAEAPLAVLGAQELEGETSDAAASELVSAAEQTHKPDYVVVADPMASKSDANHYEERPTLADCPRPSVRPSDPGSEDAAETVRYTDASQLISTSVAAEPPLASSVTAAGDAPESLPDLDVQSIPSAPVPSAPPMRPPPKPGSSRPSAPEIPTVLPDIPQHVSRQVNSETIPTEIATQPVSVPPMPMRTSVPPPKPRSKGPAARRLSEPPAKPSSRPADGADGGRPSTPEFALNSEEKISPSTLLRLREAARLSERVQGADQSRTRLSLAMALASVGRTKDSYLESLTALARARALQDRDSELASARFLAELTRASGFSEAAQQWERLL